MARGGKKGIEAGRAYVKAWFDDSLVQRGLKRMQAGFLRVSESLGNVGTKMVGLGAGLAGLLAAPLRRAAQMELIEADLAVLLGSTEKAKKALADWRKFAAETPLEFADVAQLGKQLLVWKLATENSVVDVLRQIGDASGGIPERMDGVIRALGQMRAKGRIQSQEMMQLTERGIPAWELLAQVLGTDVSGAMDAVSGGAVDTATALPALIAAMGEFGQGRMAKMAATLIGRLSALKDAFWEAVTPLGEALLPYAGRFVTLAATLVERIGGWIKANAGLAVRIAAVAAALVTFGSAAIAASVAIRAGMMVVTGLGLVIRTVLLPATIVVTGAIRLLQGAVTLMTGAVLAARAASVAVAGTLKALGLIAGTVSSVLTLASIAMTLLRRSATLTAAGLAVASGVTYAFRTAVFAAQIAVGLFAGSLKLVAAGLAVLSVTLGLLANPVVAVVAAIGAIGAAIYYATQQGLTFGAAIDWLRGRLGPLASKVMEVFRVISDALLAGEMAAAVKVLWASIQLAFAHGSEFIRGLWIDLTSWLAEQFVNLAAAVETTWSTMLAAIIAGLLSTGQKVLGVTAALAEKLGLDGRAQELRAVGAAFGIASGVAGVSGRGEEVEQRRLQTLETLAEDAARRRAAIEGSTADEAENLEKAMQAARIATDLAKSELERIPETPATTAPLVSPQVPAVASRSQQAINTAAIVGTQQGAEAFARATSGFRQVTPGEKMLGDKLDVIAKGVDGLVDKAVVIMEGNTA